MFRKLTLCRTLTVAKVLGKFIHFHKITQFYLSICKLVKGFKKLVKFMEKITVNDRTCKKWSTFSFFKSKNYIVNWINMTRKSCEHLRTTYGNTRQLFRPYHVSLAVYTVISTTSDRTSHHRLQFISHTSDAKLTSYSNCAASWPKCVLQVTTVHFTEDTVTSRATSSQED